MPRDREGFLRFLISLNRVPVSFLALLALFSWGDSQQGCSILMQIHTCVLEKFAGYFEITQLGKLCSDNYPDEL